MSQDLRHLRNSTCEKLLAICAPQVLPSLIPIQGRSTDAFFEYDFITETTCDETILQLLMEHFRRLVNTHPTFEVLSMVPQNAYEFLKGKQPLQAVFARDYPFNVVPLCKINTFYDIYPEEEFVAFDELRDVAIYELIHFEQELASGKMARCVRIRGQAFADKKALKQFNRAIEKALKNEPVQLAKELGLVELFDDDVLWCPKGMVFRELITSIWKDECLKRGDLSIAALDPARVIRERMQYGRYASITPLPTDEFPEGLFQCASNLAFEHFLFTSEAALANELISSLQFIAKMASILNLEVHVVLVQKGKQVPHELISALSSLGIAYETRQGERAEIVFEVRDLRGRGWQVSRLTVDRKRAVLLHLVPISSLERVLALLLERGEGFLPVLLAPEQARVLLVDKESLDWAKEVVFWLRERSIRLSIDEREISLQQKMLEASKEKVPFVLIIGSKEQVKRAFQVRDLRQDTQSTQMSLESFYNKMEELRNS